MAHVYERSLRVVLRHRVATMFVTFLMLAETVHLFMTMPTGFIPPRPVDSLWSASAGWNKQKTNTAKREDS